MGERLLRHKQIPPYIEKNMSDLAEAKNSYNNGGNTSEGGSPYRVEQLPLGIIEHLKEDFGDYSDLTTYDWTRHESD